MQVPTELFDELAGVVHGVVEQELHAEVMRDTEQRVDHRRLVVLARIAQVAFVAALKTVVVLADRLGQDELGLAYDVVDAPVDREQEGEEVDALHLLLDPRERRVEILLDESSNIPADELDDARVELFLAREVAVERAHAQPR